MAPAKKVNTEFNRESIAPIPSEIRKHREEMENPTTGVGGWLKDQSGGVGKPKGSPDTKATLIEPGTSTAGDGSADGGINSDEPPEPKAKSKL